MKTYGSIILPKDLLRDFIQKDRLRAWLNGFLLQDENVFVCLQLQFDDEEVVNVPDVYYDRLCSHRSFRLKGSKFTTQMVLLVKCSSDFSKKILGTEELTIDDFTAGAGLTREQIVATRFCAFVGTPQDKPRVIGLLLCPQEHTIIFGQLDVVIIGSQPKSSPTSPANLEVLASKRVVIVGIGSGGSEIALNLASSGIGHLEIIDFDRVHTNNYFRSTFDRRDLGREKVQALTEIITEHELGTHVTTKDINIVQSPEQFLDILATQPDLVIVATDTVASRRFVNYSCYKLHIPTIIAGTLLGGRISEVFAVGGHFTACYECLRTTLGAALEPVEEQSADPYLGGEELEIGSSAMRGDVAVAASLATRVALSLLDPKQFSPIEHSYTVFCREASPELRAPFKCEGPLGLYFVDISPDPECLVCGSTGLSSSNKETRTEFDRIIAEIDLDANESDDKTRSA